MFRLYKYSILFVSNSKSFNALNLFNFVCNTALLASAAILILAIELLLDFLDLPNLAETKDPPVAC